MLVEQKIGNINSHSAGKNIDWLELEWHEAGKRILHKKTRSGKDISMRFLKENPHFTQGDVIYVDAETLIAIHIRPCEAIVIEPKNTLEIVTACYEIGNRHLPLFFQDNALLVAYEAPLFNLLVYSGYAVRKENRALTTPVKTSVAAHLHFNIEDALSDTLKISTFTE